MTPSGSTRRSFLVCGSAGLCLATLTDIAAAATTPLNMKLGWLGVVISSARYVPSASAISRKRG